MCVLPNRKERRHLFLSVLCDEKLGEFGWLTKNLSVIGVYCWVNMSWQLTEGALATIMRGGTVEDPVMQILGSKRIAGTGASERYRLLVSDGCHLNSFAMLATQLNDKLTSGELSDYSVVRMNRLITSMVNNGGRGEKRVMIILDLTILAKGTEVGMKIGNPVAFPEGGSGTAAAPAQPARPAMASPAQSRSQMNSTVTAFNFYTPAPAAVAARKKRKADLKYELIMLARGYLKKPESESQLVAKTWALKLKRMKSDQRRLAEKFIGDILFEGESGNLHHNSVQIIATQSVQSTHTQEVGDNSTDTSMSVASPHKTAVVVDNKPQPATEVLLDEASTNQNETA